MSGKPFKVSLMVLALLLLAACGTIDPPIWEQPTATVTPIPPTRAAAITAAPVQASATPVPPTATLQLPTVTTAATESAAQPVPTTPAQTSNDPIAFFVSQSNPDHGKELFNTFFDKAGYMCATCHRVDSTQMLIGPGLLGVSDWAAQNIKDQIPQRYIYNSIMTPRAYTVPGFEDKAQLMPIVYPDIFSEQDVYDLVAYLMSLK